MTPAQRWSVAPRPPQKGHRTHRLEDRPCGRSRTLWGWPGVLHFMETCFVTNSHGEAKVTADKHKMLNTFWDELIVNGDPIEVSAKSTGVIGIIVVQLHLKRSNTRIVYFKGKWLTVKTGFPFMKTSFNNLFTLSNKQELWKLLLATSQSKFWNSLYYRCFFSEKWSKQKEAMAWLLLERKN